MDQDTTAPRKSKLPLVAGIYLVAMFCFVWGFAVARYKVFPWILVGGIEADITAFVRGDVHDDTTITERLLNDANLVPARQIRAFQPSDPTSFREIELTDRRNRRDQPRVWVSPDAPENYRIIAGGFDFEDAFWGAVLLDPAGDVVHRWRMSGEYEGLTDVPDVLLNLYGLGFFPDGSAAYTLQEWAGGLLKVDVCSRVEWILGGPFHHVAAPTEDFSAFWTFGGTQADLHPALLLVDQASGNVLKQIDMAAVERANPDVLIFSLHRNRNTPNATHPNDIEPLPAAIADRYPDFSPGDLLISYHTTNLVFVLDPETLKIKWWYVGSGDGQHDPDWRSDGTITVFNNNYRAEWREAKLSSTIVEIDPGQHSHRVIVDGEKYNFYSEFNGHHLVTPDETVLITSSTQGRMFEVDLNTGETVFEFVNAYDWKDGKTLHLSEAFVVDAETAEAWLRQDCSNN
jgi:hypothetical protein